MKAMYVAHDVIDALSYNSRVDCQSVWYQAPSMVVSSNNAFQHRPGACKDIFAFPADCFEHDGDEIKYQHTHYNMCTTILTHMLWMRQCT